MKIGLIAPSPVPFQVGGAERLFGGLQRYINRSTNHACEVIKLPSPEHDFASLVASYEAFANLDVSHFDLVISGKYPGWMVKHDHHVLYMLHRLRGLYDSYHLFGLSDEPRSRNPAVNALLKWLADVEREGAYRRTDAKKLFEQVRDLQAQLEDDILFRFPGPFARKVIRHLDNVALGATSIRRFAAISRTVKERQDYFPPGVDVRILHPPSDLEGLGPGPDDYLFTVSRLDSAKRIHLIIDAMQYVSADVPLLIAGTGPDETPLRERAAGDPRIRFLGYVSDDQTATHYRHALAVPYVPLDEDYGLVTIEAMMCSKPVVTAGDAGGPNEFVRDGITGFSVASDARAIGERLDYLCNHRGHARAMGRDARRFAEQIDWGGVVRGLLGEPTKANRANRRRPLKVTVATTFPIHPPQGGGQSRAFHLYRHLARTWKVDIVSFGSVRTAAFDGEIAPGLREIRVPKSEEHERAEQAISAACDGIPVTDVCMPRLYTLTPAYDRALRKSIGSSDVVVACHPYLMDAIAACAEGRPVWYEAQDVEIDLKSEILPRNDFASTLLEDVARVESRCWHDAALAYACSGTDLERLQVRYGETRAVQHVVPNGVAADDVAYVSIGERRALKRRLGLAGYRVALFMGSWHSPNLRAIERLLNLAPSCPDVNFLVVGSAGEAFRNLQLPANVGMTGVVDEPTKIVVLSIADVALNPITGGSGTNLKMVEYFAAGIPVVSTQFGLRGLSFVHGEHLHVAAVGDFPSAIAALLHGDESEVEAMSRRARARVETDYDWAMIAQHFRAAVESGRESGLVHPDEASRRVDIS